MKRLTFLDGLRGFAALEVLISHYVLAFAPAIGAIDPEILHPAWQNWFIHSPAFFVADGYVAVSIFFLISGMVLTYSFEASKKSFTTQTLRRIARLDLPLVASVVLGAGWYLVFTKAHVDAATLLGGDAWLRNSGPKNVTFGAIIYESLTALILGHAHFSLVLPGQIGSRAGLMDIANSFNSPLWTLHLEMYGSMIVLILVTLERRLSDLFHKAVCLIALCSLIAHPLGLFVVGYLATKLLATNVWLKISKKAIFKFFACGSILAGVFMSAHLAPPCFTAAYGKFVWFEQIPMRADIFHFYSQFGALLIFFGVLASPSSQTLLAGSLARVLGKYSFSLYLVHFPVLMTVTAFFVVRLASLGAVLSILLASLIGLTLTAALTVLFEKFIDAPATALSRKLRLFGPRTTGVVAISQVV